MSEKSSNFATESSKDMQNMPLTYLLDELICNIQQHAQTDKGYAYLMYNKAARAIDMS